MAFCHTSEISIMRAGTQLVFYKFVITRRIAPDNLRLTQPSLQFVVLKRLWPFIIFVLVVLVAALAVHIDWTWKRKLSPRGGRYFFHRVELQVPSFRQSEEKWRDDPLGGVILDKSGNLFGTTDAGGPAGNGTIFEVKSGSGTITPLAGFVGTDGSLAADALFQDSSGNLFGTDSSGGVNGFGFVFEIPKGSSGATALRACRT